MCNEINTLLKIVQAGDPTLRKPARKLTKEEILSPAIQSLIGGMRDTMRDAPGVGLAAPQVGVGVRLIVVEDRAFSSVESLSAKDLSARERKPIEFHVLINPTISIDDPMTTEYFESCLSVSGFMAVVPRAQSVQVNALDETGSPVSISASGWYARILQHEIDHLDGVLYVDRMNTSSLTTTDNYKRYIGK